MQAIFPSLLMLLLLLAPQSRANPFTHPVPTVSQNATASALSTPSSSTPLAPPTAVITPSPPTTTTGCLSNALNGTTILSAPRVTPPPAGGSFFEPVAADNDGAAAGAVAKFRQTTYYTCVTWPSTVHCGWHEPIVDASMNGAVRGRDGREMVVRAGAVAGVVGGLLFGM